MPPKHSYLSVNLMFKVENIMEKWLVQISLSNYKKINIVQLYTETCFSPCYSFSDGIQIRIRIKSCFNCCVFLKWGWGNGEHELELRYFQRPEEGIPYSEALRYGHWQTHLVLLEG